MRVMRGVEMQARDGRISMVDKKLHRGCFGTKRNSVIQFMRCIDCELGYGSGLCKSFRKNEKAKVINR